MLKKIRKLLAYLKCLKDEKYIESLVEKGLIIGINTQILEPFFLDPEHCFLISIGANCTLAPNVRLIAHDASTKRWLGYTRVGNIKIGDNCFIGDSTIILPKVEIGSNSIIGSGSIVTKYVPPNSVVAGNPARVICSTEMYLEKIRGQMNKNNVFDHNYLMRNIDSTRKAEMLKILEDGEGFIV
jgi:maltose O-acetyltransferase